MPTDVPTFQKISFDILNIASQHAIHKDDISTFTQPDLEQVVVTLKTQVAAWKPTPTLTLRYPAGWWQMLKEQYFPEGIKKLLPVKYVEQHFDAVKVLPNFPIPTNDLVFEGAVDGFIPELGGESVESPDGGEDGSTDQPE